MTEIRVAPGGTHKYTRYVSTNDNDYSITVPAGKQWEVLRIFIEYQPSADVGNRAVDITISDGTNTIWGGAESATIAATTAKGLVHGCGQHIPTTAMTGRKLSSDAQMGWYYWCLWGSVPMWLGPGYVIRVWDSLNLAPAADDMLIMVEYVEYDA